MTHQAQKKSSEPAASHEKISFFTKICQDARIRCHRCKVQKTGGFGIDLVLGSPMVPLNRSITPQAPQDLTLERPELEKLLRGNMWKLCKIVFIVMEREADLISFVRPDIFVIIKNMSEKLNQPAALPMADTPP